MEVAASGSALDGLQEFATACCPQNECSAESNCNADTLTLAATPPPAHEEFSHELASGFLFSEEMKVVRQLQAKCTEGQHLVNAIYCSRSCARAFPAVVVTDATDPARSKQYYHAIFTGRFMGQEHGPVFVVNPQVAKIKQLSEYCSQAVVLLSDNIQRTTVHENMTRAIPDIMMDALLDTMDVIIQLNHLHDTKSSLRNDFSVFKRTFLHIKDDLPDAEFIEKDIVRLQEFLREVSVRMDSPFLEYELVTKHNYSDEEWQAMADIIYSVKSVVQILRQFRLKLVACVRRSVYQQIQVFVQHTLLPILHRADKRKLACTKLLHDIRMMVSNVAVPLLFSAYHLLMQFGCSWQCGDWVDCDVLLNDFKKKRKERRFPEFRDRTASPSICQIQMLRTAVDSIYAKRSMGDLNAKSSASSTLFSFKKDLESSDIDSLQLFYREAGAFPALLDLSATLSELGDFSSVWFRELYLELAKSVQIPTEISLPWLLIEHCLDRGCSSIAQIEPVLSILDIYNDAANCSLYDLRQQWLYDEVESEGKLCFDHFVFLLAERVYLHYKLTATRDAVRRLGFCNGLAGSSRSNTISMAAKLTSCSLSPDQSAHTTSGDAKYVHILTQKQVNIFGRTYNLRFHLGQRINALLRKDVEAWVTKLETSDVTCYVAVLNLLLILKKTHASLSDLVLDEFDDLVREANDEMVECLSRSSEPHIDALLELLPERALLEVADDCIEFAVVKVRLVPTERSLQIFQCALSRIAAMLHSSGIAHEWEAGPQSQPENMPNASSFYHVWCALEFLSCNRPLVGDTVGAQAPTISLREMFGDGVQFAGCTLVHLLGQRTLYELWNVSQHVLNVHHHEQVKAAGDAQVAFTSSSKKGRRRGESSGTQTSVGTLDKDMEDKAARFVVSAHEMRATTKCIFHTLETAWPSASRPTTTFTPPSFATSTRSQAPPL
ncbi:hypothetical protein BBJ28_00003951 [Nothophytophthora sp. Chile5]|nr:hypothetical protein BBJ28_00003951 [Nothophytophthora sp. Chile5]